MLRIKNGRVDVAASTFEERVALTCSLLVQLADDMSTGHGSRASERLYELSAEVEGICE